MSTAIFFAYEPQRFCRLPQRRNEGRTAHVSGMLWWTWGETTLGDQIYKDGSSKIPITECSSGKTDDRNLFFSATELEDMK